MVDNAEIHEILRKSGVKPFYFGGKDESFYWQVALLEADLGEEIYAERSSWDEIGAGKTTYYCVHYRDLKARTNMYEAIITDFVAYYYDPWSKHVANMAFNEVALPSDEELMDILDIFNKSYSDFMHDVLYWYRIAILTNPFSEHISIEKAESSLREDERLAKQVLDVLYKDEPITILLDNVKYEWKIAEKHNEIWFSRITNYKYETHDFTTCEYGHVVRTDGDAMDALRDAVRGCYFVDGWKYDKADNGYESQLALIDLSNDDLN